MAMTVDAPNNPKRLTTAQAAAYASKYPGLSEAQLKRHRAEKTTGPPYYQPGGPNTTVFYYDVELTNYANGDRSRTGLQSSPAEFSSPTLPIFDGALSAHGTSHPSLDEILNAIEHWRVREITRAHDSHWEGTAPTFLSYSDAASAISERRYLLSLPDLDPRFDGDLARASNLPAGHRILANRTVRLYFKQAYEDVERHTDRFRSGDFTSWPEDDAAT